MSERLQDLGEEKVVARILSRLPTTETLSVGPGDDCAVVREGEGALLLKTDAVIEGMHYLPRTRAEDVGWKAIARVASDFAAMGGQPEAYLVTLALPASRELAWVEALYAGISRCLAECGGCLAGGETVGIPEGGPAMISVAGTGRATRPVLRSGGSAGESLWVTGRLGGSFASGRHLSFTPRVREGQWLAGQASAMMDLSDGLARDLPRLAEASDCGFVIERERLPRHEGCSVEEAMTEGEDFELLFAAEDGDWSAAFQRAFPEVGLSRIGRLVPRGEGDPAGAEGWQHFTS
ncbi:MAG: thiamine-phosphate kinase [Verrucomicrobiota bacterium JB023]|nr:thiamine-phosphate kinase [Verrucomicrobiota bacterium JB023]